MSTTSPAADTAVPDDEPDASGAPRTPTFASFGVPAFRVIWLGTFLYYLSIFSGMIARGALAKDLGGDNAALGLVTLAFGAVSIVMTPIGGALADRLPKRRVMIVSTLVIAVTSGGLAVTEILDITAFWMLIVASGAQAAGFALLVPARMAFTVDIVGPKLIPNAVALAQISMNSNRVIGPAIAAVFIGVAWLGYAGIYVMGAALAVAAALCFLWLPPGHPNPNRARRAPLAEIGDGLRYVGRVPSVRLVVTLAIAVTMVGFPYVAFLPSVSEDFYDRGADGFAQLSLVGAVGGLVAGFFVARTVLAQGPRVQVVSGVVLAIGLVGLGVAPSFAMTMVAVVVVGAATAAFQSMNATLALSLSDTDYHGRVQSLLSFGFSMFGLVSYPLGVLADAVGLRPTLVGMGIGVGVLVLVAEQRWSRFRGSDPALA